MGRKGKSGRKPMLKLECAQGNELGQWQKKKGWIFFVFNNFSISIFLFVDHIGLNTRLIFLLLFYNNHVSKDNRISSSYCVLLEQTYCCEDYWSSATFFNKAHLFNYCKLSAIYFIVNVCVLNQSYEHKLLNDALYSIIFMFL